MITIQGFQLVFYIASIFFSIYIMLLGVSLYQKKKILFIDGYKNPKLNISIAVILLLVLILAPVKLKTQTDNQRTHIRHSFDTTVYENDRTTDATSNPSYNLNDIREQQHPVKH